MKNYIFVVLLLLMPLSASARLMAIRDSVANGYNFWLYVPKQYKDHRADRAKEFAASAEKVKLLISEQPWNAFVPILDTPAGIYTFSTFAQL